MTVITNGGIPRMDNLAKAMDRIEDAELRSSSLIRACLPSIGRERIIDAIDTLLTSPVSELMIYPVIQENRKMTDRLRKRYEKEKNVFVLFESDRIGWVRAQNAVAKLGGALFALADDIIVTRETVRTLQIALAVLFPDGDGVVLPSLTQTNWSIGAGRGVGFAGAFPLIGHKFIDRFPDRQVFCPEYFGHGADPELRNFAISIDKYIQITEAKMIHFDFVPEERDETALIMREKSNEAVERLFARQELGYLWGKNFDMIGNSLK